MRRADYKVLQGMLHELKGMEYWSVDMSKKAEEIIENIFKAAPEITTEDDAVSVINVDSLEVKDMWDDIICVQQIVYEDSGRFVPFYRIKRDNGEVTLEDCGSQDKDVNVAVIEYVLSMLDKLPVVMGKATIEKKKKIQYEGYPKYWCYTECGACGAIRRYKEIWTPTELEQVEEQRNSLPDGWKGFITDSFSEASIYEND